MKILSLFEKRKEALAGFDETLLGQLFNQWKVDYGFAIYGNYTFYLPIEEVNRRWDKAHASEQKFNEMLFAISSLTKIPSWIHTIEAEIHALEQERELVLASNPPGGTRTIDFILRGLKALVKEARDGED